MSTLLSSDQDDSFPQGDRGHLCASVRPFPQRPSLCTGSSQSAPGGLKRFGFYKAPSPRVFESYNVPGRGISVRHYSSFTDGRQVPGDLKTGL